MNVLKIGVKFCGGCQSKYNRKKLLENIKNCFTYNFEYVKESEIYDFIIVISGCPIKCANLNVYKTNNGIINLDSKNYLDYKKIISDFIENLKMQC